MTILIYRNLRNFLIYTITMLVTVGLYADVLIPDQKAFRSCATNPNGKIVADEIFAVSTLATITPGEIQLINILNSLSCEERGVAFDAISGSQYAELLPTSELAVRQFARRLYDPLRSFMVIDPNCEERDCDNQGIMLWADGGALYNSFNSTKHGHGCKNNGYQITAGGQYSCETSWTVGVGLSYQETKTHFNFCGSAETKNMFGGLYGAYKMCDFYLLGDAILGGATTQLHRSFTIGSDLFREKANPQVVQGLLYGEIGKDFRCDRLLIQPFLGLEGGYFFYRHFREHGDDPVDLQFHRRRYGTFDIRLGTHFAMEEVTPGLYIGVDLAWQYRCTDFNGYLEQRFASFDVYDGLDNDPKPAFAFKDTSRRGHKVKLPDTVVDPRTGKEVKVEKPKGIFYKTFAADPGASSFVASVNVEQDISDYWTVYVTGNLQQWTNARAYDVLAGLSLSW